MEKVENIEKLFKKYLENTHSGKALLNKHYLMEYGVWEVFGEDPNCDFGGPHHEPSLGHFEGKLGDVVAKAVTLNKFWQWGAGGRIKRLPTPTKVESDFMKKEKLLQREKALREEIEELHDVYEANRGRLLAELQKLLTEMDTLGFKSEAH